MALDTANLSSSYNYAAVTPSDTISFSSPFVTRYLYIGGAGNVAAVLENGTAVTFTGMLVGTVYPIRCKRVNQTNTTATNIVALF